MGFGGGLSIPALHTYIGEMGSVMDQIREKKGKKPLKFTVYVAFSFIMNGGFVVAFGEYVHATHCFTNIIFYQFVVCNAAGSFSHSTHFRDRH